MVLKKQVSARLLAATGKFRKWCWVFQSVQAGVAVQRKQHARAHGFQTEAPTVEQSRARKRVCWAKDERGLAVSCLRKRYMSVGTLTTLRFVAVLQNVWKPLIGHWLTSPWRPYRIRSKDEFVIGKDKFDLVPLSHRSRPAHFFTDCGPCR